MTSQGNSAFGFSPVCRGSSYYLQDRAVGDRGCPAGHELLFVEECRAALALMTGRTVVRYRPASAAVYGCHLEEHEWTQGTDHDLETVVKVEAVFLHRHGANKRVSESAGVLKAA
eukprot:2668915-Pyramimonas_sp.AAC.1